MLRLALTLLFSVPLWAQYGQIYSLPQIDYFEPTANPVPGGIFFSSLAAPSTLVRSTASSHTIEFSDGSRLQLLGTASGRNWSGAQENSTPMRTYSQSGQLLTTSTAFATLNLPAAWPGVDVQLANPRSLFFTIAAGARWEQIRLTFLPSPNAPSGNNTLFFTVRQDRVVTSGSLTRQAANGELILPLSGLNDSQPILLQIGTESGLAPKSIPYAPENLTFLTFSTQTWSVYSPPTTPTSTPSQLIALRDTSAIPRGINRVQGWGPSLIRGLETANGVLLADTFKSSDGHALLLDTQTGALRALLPYNIPVPFQLNDLATNSDGDILLAGQKSIPTPRSTFTRGFLMRWQPLANRLIFSLELPDPVLQTTFAPNGDSFTISRRLTPTADPVSESQLDFQRWNPAGAALIAPSILNVPGASLSPVRLVADNADGVYLIFLRANPIPFGNGAIGLARWDASSKLAFTEPWAVFSAQITVVRDPNLPAYVELNDPLTAAITPSGALDVRFGYPGPTEFTSPNAAISGYCRNSIFRIIYSPTGERQYASYELRGPSAPLRCSISPANGLPQSSLSPGQLVTLVGGGFGPLEPVAALPNAAGKFPTSLAGYEARLDGRPAPILAVSRGKITLQWPTDLSSNGNLLAELTGPDVPRAELSLGYSSLFSPSFFTVPQNPATFPTRATLARHADGTLNSQDNPARPGDILTVYGTGLDMGTLPEWGGLWPSSRPQPQPQLRTPDCFTCQVQYLGSAPGLTSGLFQMNIRILPVLEGNDTRLVNFYPAILLLQNSLFLWVKP